MNQLKLEKVETEKFLEREQKFERESGKSFGERKTVKSDTFYFLGGRK